MKKMALVLIVGMVLLASIDLLAEKKRWMMFDGISGSLGYSSEHQSVGFWNFSGLGLFISPYKADPYPLVGLGLRFGEAFNAVAEDLVSLFPVYVYFTPLMKMGEKRVHRVLGVSSRDSGINQRTWTVDYDPNQVSIPVVKYFAYLYVGGSLWAIVNNWENEYFGKSQYLNIGAGFCLPIDFRTFDQTIGMGPFSGILTRMMLQLETGVLLASIDRSLGGSFVYPQTVNESHFYISLKLSIFSWIDIR